MWFDIKATDVGFADRSKRHFSYDFRVAGEPAAVFRAITDPTEFGRWFPDHRGVRWITAEPHGVGSLREVRLRGLAVHEQILVWEPGRRFAFCLVKMSAPLLARMVEDFRLSDAGDGQTRVVWTIAFKPKLLAGALVPILRPVFGKMFRKATVRLREHMAATA